VVQVQRRIANVRVLLGGLSTAFAAWADRMEAPRLLERCEKAVKEVTGSRLKGVLPKALLLKENSTQD
jgi:hypothetical protein